MQSTNSVLRHSKRKTKSHSTEYAPHLQKQPHPPATNQQPSHSPQTFTPHWHETGTDFWEMDAQHTPNTFKYTDSLCGPGSLIHKPNRCHSSTVVLPLRVFAALAWPDIPREPLCLSRHASAVVVPLPKFRSLPALTSYHVALRLPNAARVIAAFHQQSTTLFD